MSKLVNFNDKVFLQELAEIPEINKVTDDNMNNIKTSVNNLYSVLGIYTDTYNSSTTYSVNDLVIDNNTLYKSLTNNNTGNTPSSDGGTNWIDVSITSLFYPVGSYYETSDANFDPNVVWGGTWVLEEDGTVLVSKSSTSGSLFNDSIGTVVGEEKHTLTVDEMPSHAHQADYSASAGVGVGVTAMGNKLGTSTLIKSAGGGQAHNIVQPSKICYRWHRTA